MHVAFRSARPQLSLRALLMLGAATLMVIVGLLAMHTFTANQPGTDRPGSPTQHPQPAMSTPLT